jgi:hypothetical protein
MNLYLALYKNGRYSVSGLNSPAGCSFTKEVPWQVPPPKGSTIFVGEDDINAEVTGVWWCDDGRINVEAEIANAGEEYDDLYNGLLDNGFANLTYERKT